MTGLLANESLGMLSAMAPDEAGYEAILDAVMASERGRNFLTEYAKRNRHADTRMLLGVLDRIEATLRLQRPAAQEPGTRADLVHMTKAIAHARADIAALRAVAAQSAADPFVATAAAIEGAGRSVRKTAEQIADIAFDLRQRDDAPSNLDLDTHGAALFSACARIGDGARAAETVAALMADLDKRLHALLARDADERETPPVADSRLEPVAGSERDAAADIVPSMAAAAAPREDLQTSSVSEAAPDETRIDASVDDIHAAMTNLQKAGLVSAQAVEAAYSPEPPPPGDQADASEATDAREAAATFEAVTPATTDVRSDAIAKETPTPEIEHAAEAPAPARADGARGGWLSQLLATSDPAPVSEVAPPMLAATVPDNAAADEPAAFAELHQVEHPDVAARDMAEMSPGDARGTIVGDIVDSVIHQSAAGAVSVLLHESEADAQQQTFATSANTQEHAHAPDGDVASSDDDPLAFLLETPAQIDYPAQADDGDPAEFLLEPLPGAAHGSASADTPLAASGNLAARLAAFKPGSTRATSEPARKADPLADIMALSEEERIALFR